MAGQGCPGEGPDTRFLGWLICPIQKFLSYQSAKEPAWLVRRTRKVPEPFFDYEETLRRLGKKPPSMEYATSDEVWYRDFVTFGLAWPPYVVIQGGKIGRYFSSYLGWRKDSNWGGFIAIAAQFKRNKTTPLHRGY